MTLLDAMTAATRKGYKVSYAQEDCGGWWITTPKRPRHASEEHGSFKTEARAWFCAALMASEHD